MKKTAAWLAVYALEQLGVRHTFGIPGVHNTELYDELAQSKVIEPLLVTHEGGGAFMAEAYSRISEGERGVGCLVIVPAAGFTHAASGIGEAFLDGVPLLVISGGIRQDTPHGHKLHAVDQMELAKGITKAAFRITRHADVVPTLFRAHRIAQGGGEGEAAGQPGPVLVEIPVDLQLFPGEVPNELPRYTPTPVAPVDESMVQAATDVLMGAKKVGIFAGWGARGAKAELIALAEALQAPVATTLQGLSVFPGDHPLHVGFGFGPSAVPAAQNAFKDCDAVLAVGTRFGEIPTGSFGMTVPPALVHIDIDAVALNLNYPALVAWQADAKAALRALLAAVQTRGVKAPDAALTAQIASDKAAYQQAWLAHNSQGRVNPARFFNALRAQMPADAITVLDDGNHTFLTAELFPIARAGRLITPTDFNAMGYAVPAAIGAKLCRPEHEVFSIVGDGCFAMTGLEILTASAQSLGVIYFVFNDGELSQIAQAQQLPYQRKACTRLFGLNLEGVALATGAAYLALKSHDDLERVIAQARELAATNRAVIVDVAIDYSRQTAFTRGTSQSTFKRFATMDKLRFVKRIVWRKLTGVEDVG